ncbi:MAG: hypothetical protein LC649_10400 [Bacteroidales bacterium]|nr:hypothetical protein [Bacteroidales bacterium]
MKKTVFTLAATAFIAVIIITSCNSSSQKIENAEDNLQNAKEAVIDARTDLNLAVLDSITEFQQFKLESQNEIIANEKSIAGLKLRFADASQENKILYEKKVAELEEKNSALKVKLAEYQEGNTDQWQIFKSEFNRDMADLRKALSDFTTNNKK